MSKRALRPQNSFTEGIVKNQSLDFGERDDNAHLYRLKLLEEQKNKKQGQAPMSKMGEDLKKKKEKQDAAGGEGGGHGGHGISDTGEKSSFGESTFNMANILMVRGNYSFSNAAQSALPLCSELITFSVIEGCGNAWFTIHFQECRMVRRFLCHSIILIHSLPNICFTWP
jgi:hypothetical protein